MKVAGRATEDDIEKLRQGIRIGSKPGCERLRSVRTAPAQVRLVRESDNPWYEVTLTQGKNRQIRRMFEEIGHHVEKIKRTRYGRIALDVEPGKFRALTPREVNALSKSVRERTSRPPERRTPVRAKVGERRSDHGKDKRASRSR